MTDPGVSSATDFRALHRKLEDALAEIVHGEHVEDTLELILDALVGEFSEELGFTGGRIYKRRDDGHYLCCGFGSCNDPQLGHRVPDDYPPHLRTLAEGLVILRPGDPEHADAFSGTCASRSTLAAMAVGKKNKYVVAFTIDEDAPHERVLYSLTAVRHVVNLKLEQEAFTGMLEEARTIQESMLPDSAPEFPGYEIAGRTRAAERVGGDVYDFLPLGGGLLGVAIADSSGHGVPAALLARDVVTGLRSLAGVDTDVRGVVERLNRVIHRAALSSKFVSLFYAELAPDGALVYCNAGHNPPLLLRPGSWVELPAGGPVLGPLPEARYEIGAAQLAPGDTLVLYTDGLVDQAGPSEEPFGTARLREVLSATSGAAVRDVVDALHAAVDRHANGAAPADDVTVLVVRRT